MFSLESLYSSPKKVFLVFIILSFLGVFSFFKLPVYLFPNTSKPKIFIQIQVGNMSPGEFYKSYGESLERQIKSIQKGSLSVERVSGEYGDRQVFYEVEFPWGENAEEARTEVDRVAHAAAAQMPEAIRSTLWVGLSHRNAGFFALSYYSHKRSSSEVYEIVEPKLMPKLAEVKDAESPFLYNPKLNKLSIELRLSDVLLLDLKIDDVKTAIINSLKSYNAGELQIGSNKIAVYIPPKVKNSEDFKDIPLLTSKGKIVKLSQVADILLGPSEDSGRVFKTSGYTSLILFASPKAQGNIKRMSEEIIEKVKFTQLELPADIQYKIIVDPSEFIRHAIAHVGFEVLMASGLAVFVLFFFMGNLRNVVTAAIEIPLSILLAFILMYLFGVPINLISLGGFALSAGMNVDASIVVMENIFRLFAENKNPKSFSERLKLIVQAVREVRIPIISSTLISLVVFAPLLSTSALTSALLGDLARAVIYSHGLCIVISLFLVPVIRLMTLKSGVNHESSPLDKPLEKFQKFYKKVLEFFLFKPARRWGALLGLFAFLILTLLLILPKLPREIMAQPDTDWLFLQVTQSNSKNSRQMLAVTDKLDSEIRLQWAQDIEYTYLQVNGATDSNIMLRLKSKKRSVSLLKALESKYKDTPFTKFRIFPWNPSEIDFPDPAHMEIEIQGGADEGKREIAQELLNFYQDQKTFDRVSSEPSATLNQSLHMYPIRDLYPKLSFKQNLIESSNLSRSLYLFDNTEYIGDFTEKSKSIPIQLKWKEDYKQDLSRLSALPIKIGDSVYPLKAFYDFRVEKAPTLLQTNNLRSRFLISARLNNENYHEKSSRQKTGLELLKKWKMDNANRVFADEKFSNYQVDWVDSERDLQNTLKELALAMLVSLALVSLILYWQFNSWTSTAIVLLAIPFALIGAVLSLFIFQSTLSLNSALGVILLNGIAVANSILLVDFMDHSISLGRKPFEAAIEASFLRLRPILITSLTTILGMLPVALGWGDGGKVLQPLGIAVSGGLWISMCLTIVLVPVLYAGVLEKRLK